MIKNMYVRISAAFGLLAAVLILLYFFGFYWLHYNPLLYMSTFDLTLPVICMTLAMFYYRDKLMNGHMHFWEGLFIGLLTNVVATSLSALAIYFFIAFVDTDLLGRHISDLQQLLMKSKQQMDEQFGKGAFDTTRQQLSSTTTAHVALDIFIKKFLICLFASGFVAAVLRKNQ
jgi:hypothetical protein